VLLGLALFIYAQIDTETLTAEGETYVRTEVELRNAVKDSAKGTAVVIVLGRHINLTKTTLTIPSGAKITLRSNKEATKKEGVEFFRLSGVEDESTLTVETGGLLNLEGIIVTHNKGAYGWGVDVNPGGTLTMIDGEISNNTAGIGGGIYNQGNFSLSGGTITQNTAEEGAGVYNGNNATPDRANFTMSGGEISNNIANRGGGGVDNCGSCIFSLTGGVISGNTAKQGGGGVNNHHSGIFYLIDGIISGNIANWGGGVNIWGGEFIMSGGEISNNTATNIASGGGGVAFDGSRFNMTGGIISNNRALNGGGMYTSNGEVWLLGGEIANNVASNNGGGAFVGNLWGFYVYDGVVFSNNQAVAAYNRHPQDNEVYHTQIGSKVVWTAPFRQGYNNYDISYTNGTLASLK